MVGHGHLIDGLLQVQQGIFGEQVGMEKEDYDFQVGVLEAEPVFVIPLLFYQLLLLQLHSFEVLQKHKHNHEAGQHRMQCEYELDFLIFEDNQCGHEGEGD